MGTFHSLEIWSRVSRYGFKEPLGVAYPFIPVETGQAYLWTPSTTTLISWRASSIEIKMLAADARRVPARRARRMTTKPACIFTSPVRAALDNVQAWARFRGFSRVG